MKIMSIAFAAVCLLPFGTVFGQQSGSATVEQVKSALLHPKGFTFEGDCQDGSSFTGENAFKEEGGKVKVVATCDVVVEISGSEVQWTSCRGNLVKVLHYPSNANEPFKGTVGPFCTFIMKPK